MIICYNTINTNINTSINKLNYDLKMIESDDKILNYQLNKLKLENLNIKKKIKNNYDILEAKKKVTELELELDSINNKISITLGSLI